MLTALPPTRALLERVTGAGILLEDNWLANRQHPVGIEPRLVVETSPSRASAKMERLHIGTSLGVPTADSALAEYLRLRRVPDVEARREALERLATVPVEIPGGGSVVEEPLLADALDLDPDVRFRLADSPDGCRRTSDRGWSRNSWRRPSRATCGGSLGSIHDLGLNPESFEFYLKAFRYEMPPHGGWGLGIDRLVQKTLDLPNIREAILFPRDRTRLVP